MWSISLWSANTWKFPHQPHHRSPFQKAPGLHVTTSKSCSLKYVLRSAVNAKQCLLTPWGLFAPFQTPLHPASGCYSFACWTKKLHCHEFSMHLGSHMPFGWRDKLGSQEVSQVLWWTISRYFFRDVSTENSRCHMCPSLPALQCRCLAISGGNQSLNWKA